MTATLRQVETHDEQMKKDIAVVRRCVHVPPCWQSTEPQPFLSCELVHSEVQNRVLARWVLQGDLCC